MEQIKQQHTFAVTIHNVNRLSKDETFNEFSEKIVESLRRLSIGKERIPFQRMDVSFPKLSCSVAIIEYNYQHTQANKAAEKAAKSFLLENNIAFFYQFKHDFDLFILQGEPQDLAHLTTVRNVVLGIYKKEVEIDTSIKVSAYAER